MQIWPVIQIRSGQCVLLEQGDFSRQTICHADPLEAARRWVAAGATQLHIVDLDAACTASGDMVRQHNRELIISLIRAVQVPCQVGGGLRTEEDLDRYVQAGASRLVCATRAAADRTWIYEMCHLYPGRMIAAIDARDGQVATEGRQGSPQIRALDLARELSLYPLQGIICTDIDRDGTLSGPNIESLAQVARSVAIPVIGAGGIASPGDIRTLAGLGIDGCLLDRALYDGVLTLEEAHAAARGAGPPSGIAPGRTPSGDPT